MLETSLFDYDLPQSRIAKEPVEPRDHSKLLICESQGRMGDFSGPFTFTDHAFKDIADALNENDVLIFNNAKVLPVRMLGKREDTGGAVEAVLLESVSEQRSEAILNLTSKVFVGMKLVFEPGLMATVLTSHEDRKEKQGVVTLEFFGPGLNDGLSNWLLKYGHIPLPHYIERSEFDRSKELKRYQTVYAVKEGSAAAPTAGFHFTQELLEKLRLKKVEMLFLTLHVGLGTFRPIKAETIEGHEMHVETYEISKEFAAQYRQLKSKQKRIIAVGTTSLRALESWVRDSQELNSGVYKTRAYFKPGEHFQSADELITNFHLPRSTLIVLVAAAMGIEAQKQAYAHALSADYRFYSYGDAMWIRGRRT